MVRGIVTWWLFGDAAVTTAEESEVLCSGRRPRTSAGAPLPGGDPIMELGDSSDVRRTELTHRNRANIKAANFMKTT